MELARRVRRADRIVSCAIILEFYIMNAFNNRCLYRNEIWLIIFVWIINRIKLCRSVRWRAHIFFFQLDFFSFITSSVPKLISSKDDHLCFDKVWHPSSSILFESFVTTNIPSHITWRLGHFAFAMCSHPWLPMWFLSWSIGKYWGIFFEVIPTKFVIELSIPRLRCCFQLHRNRSTQVQLLQILPKRVL